MNLFKLVWICGRSSAVEHNLAKVGVDGSNPFARSIFFKCYEWYQLCPGGGMVDTGDLKSPGHCDRAGSSPAPGTIDETSNSRFNYILYLMFY